jgi:hypothetical protein
MKTLEQKATEAMSRYIRLRDAIEYNSKFPEDITGTQPEKLLVACCTCGDIKKWTRMDAGHFISKGSRGKSGVRFDERNINTQCKTCNGFLQGNTLVYLDFMLKKYGEKVVKELRKKDLIKKQITPLEYRAMIKYYKEEFEKLKAKL